MAWWRHQMETFSALQAICGGNSTVTGEFPTQRPVTQNFDVFFDLRLNKHSGLDYIIFVSLNELLNKNHWSLPEI